MYILINLIIFNINMFTCLNNKDIDKIINLSIFKRDL